jgi:hypothetical protein
METASMSPDLSKTRLSATTLITIALFLLAVIARVVPGARTVDDAYITFRYTRNILSGNGFLYNPGERVLGTTTPLYAGLLALAALPAGSAQAPFPLLAMGINALADGLTCVLLFHLGRRLGFPWAGLGAALAWAIAPFSVTFAIGGLETSVYVLLLVALAYAHLRERHVPAAFLAALALLTRPDALLLIGPLALDRAWQIIRPATRAASSPPLPHRGQATLDEDQSLPSSTSSRIPFLKENPKSLLIEALAFFVPAATWAALSIAYFGSPIPHSITAKSVAYRLRWEEGLIRLLQHYTTPFLEHLTFGMRWIGIGLVLYPFLYLVGARNALRTSARIWPFALYPWLYLAAFAIANPLIFRWYLTPPLPALFLFILAGAEQIIASLAGGDRHLATGAHRRLSQALLLILVVLLPTVLMLREWRLHPDHGLSRPAPDMAWYKLELLYRQVAETLAPEIQQRTGTPPTLAAGDVGVLGFYSGARILDTVGLNSPQSTSYYPLDPAFYVINYAIPPDLILDEKPDYVVILEVYGREGLLKDPRFWQQYALRQTIPTDIYGSDGMLILERKP